MKKLLKRIALGLLVLLVLSATAFALAVKVRQHRTFTAPYPDLHASSDPAVIERGRYLAFGPAHCVSCHTTPGAGTTSFSGGFKFALPVGEIYAPNITPDVGTGIGRYTDPEIARILRYGVHPTGRAVLPFMPFSDLTDDDLVAVISYLRSRPAVDNAVPDHDLNAIGKIAKAFMLEPTGPSKPLRRSVTVEPTVAYGEYLVNTVGNCAGCHTQRDVTTITGVPLSGGLEMESHLNPEIKFITPNLTPHETGSIRSWSEDAFVARFQHGVDSESPMPWGAFRNMSENDLRAIYRYLRSLPPATQGQLK